MLEIKSASPYTPVRSTSNEGVKYVAWTTKIVEERTPELKEEGVREEVVAAIQLEKARNDAEASARAVAGKCEKEGSLASLKDAVRVSAPFTWFTQYPDQYQMRISYSPIYVANANSAEGAESEFIMEDPNEEVMSAIFGANVGDIVVVSNTAKTFFYTIRVKEFLPDAKSLQDRFIQIGAQLDFNSSDGQLYWMTLREMMNNDQVTWKHSLEEN